MEPAEPCKVPDRLSFQPGKTLTPAPPDVSFRLYRIGQPLNAEPTS